MINQDFLNEIISFSITILVVLFLAFLTKKKQDQFKNKKD